MAPVLRLTCQILLVLTSVVYAQSKEVPLLMLKTRAFNLAGRIG